MYSQIYKDDYSLFDYQTQSKKEIFAAWDSHDAIMYQMPTGTGKTRLFTSVIRDIIRRTRGCELTGSIGHSIAGLVADMPFQPILS